jgi:pyruvate kinase
MSRNQRTAIELLKELEDIRRAMLRLEDEFAPELAKTDDSFRRSAKNLLDYLALRHQEVRPLQEELASLGLSSLGRSEAHVMATVVAVSQILRNLSGSRSEAGAFDECVDFVNGKALLKQHTEALLGRSPGSRRVPIMVTLPTEAATDHKLVKGLVAQGMDCARINTAHDGPGTWQKMAKNVREAAHELNHNCRILMDLAGPKLRAGAIEPGPHVIEWHPQRDGFGCVTRNARIWLTPEQARVSAKGAVDATLPVAGSWLAMVHAGDVIEFADARGSNRSLHVTAAEKDGCLAECRQTSYVTPGLALQVRRRGKTLASMGKIGDLRAREQAITLKPGDTLIVTRDSAPGRPALLDAHGKVSAPATILCSLPEVLAEVNCGERIWFDDGKIGGTIKDVIAEQISVLITHAREKGSKLRADKGINLPDSSLSVPALTQQDLDNLPLVIANADLVSMSFVRSAQDVLVLQSELSRLNGQHLGIVLKIETKQGFEQVPNLLLALMRHHVGGVMIARGDLAVECGYERLAELQEEILWVCEAAHMPVIWATQVLESLAKGGLPSRAEITDAAMSERAECVMLNKGPRIVEAVGVLDDILCRMEAHQDKKTSTLRPLHLKPTHEHN